MNPINDVIIIGAGPAGLSAAIYSGRALLDTLVLEKGAPGGQILMTDFIENYPGFPEGIAPFQLTENFKKQAERFGAKMERDEVKAIQKKDDLWQIQGGKQAYATRTVIVATGANFRKLGVKGEGKFTGKGVSYCATCDAFFFKDKVVGVVGGGNWALTEALLLTKFARQVKVFHRRDQFRAEKILQDRTKTHKKIDIVWDTVIEEIKGHNILENLSVKNVKTGAVSEVKIDGLFVSIGTIPNSEFVKDLVDRNEWGEIVVGKKMTTSQPGIYAVGDVSDACPQQVATAVGTGVAAAIAVDEYLQGLG
ncbi:MAG: thioredoxin-disulfide reductase [Candidatus Aminicenantes bacterium]|nr:thioredoxin-disulfide reductase [Candidatus Aminicenantes bacterium]